MHTECIVSSRNLDKKLPVPLWTKRPLWRSFTWCSVLFHFVFFCMWTMWTQIDTVTQNYVDIENCENLRFTIRKFLSRLLRSLQLPNLKNGTKFFLLTSKSRFQIFIFKRHSVEDARIVKFPEIGKHMHFQILYFFR